MRSFLVRSLRISPAFAIAIVANAVALLFSPTPALAGKPTTGDACKHGGYNALVGTAGQTFATQGQCVTFAQAGGQFATGMIIPKGETAALTDAYFGSCSSLTYGYQLNYGTLTDVSDYPGGCDVIGVPAPGATLGPYSTAELLRIYLRESAPCSGWLFWSDNPKHASVTGSNPYIVKISDGGGYCQAPPDVQYGPDGGSFGVTVTIG